MAEQFDQLKDNHIDFIQQQKLFFVGTADVDGFVNVSPKGMDCFRVVHSTCVRWLNLTGSGNESAAHILACNRMTMMFCSFDKLPLILRLYGRAMVCHHGDDSWNEQIAEFPNYINARQLFTVELQMIQTSCGFAVPYYEFNGERPTLQNWAEKRGDDGIKQYWQEKNTQSLNGKPTGMPPPTQPQGTNHA